MQPVGTVRSVDAELLRKHQEGCQTTARLKRVFLKADHVISSEAEWEGSVEDAELPRY